MVLSIVFTIFIGLAGGIAVGSGFVAFLTVLGIIPRLIQLTKTYRYIRFFEWAVILGAIGASSFHLSEMTFQLFVPLVIGVGLLCGIFIGMLAAALYEVLNVLPILAKRIGIEGKLALLLMAIVFGKVFGSMFQWLYFVKS